eukprot:COSAG06_NODE_3726_length_4971_cov_20.589901_2_plen_786_part_00
MYSVQHVLVTHNMTIIMSRHANHPTQVQVEIEDRSIVDAGGNVTKMFFQLHNADVTTRQRCTLVDYPAERHNITFENSFLSYLGVRDQLRHWAVSDNDGARMVDYYDYHNSTSNKPHSVVYKPGQSGSAEMKIYEMDEQIDDGAVAAWLHVHFHGANNLYNMSDLFTCDRVSMAKDTPAMLGPFKEIPDTVDWYTKDMLQTPVDPELDEMLVQTSMRKYWGSAMYLRRLLSEYNTDTSNAEAEAEDAEADDIQPEGVGSALRWDFDDPWFWREVGTQWGVANYSSQPTVVPTLWSAIASALDVADVEALRMRAAEQSGLTNEQLLRVPAPVGYIAKGAVHPGDSGFSIAQLSFVLDSWNSSAFDDATSIYVVFGRGSACSDRVYRVTNSSGRSFTVGEVVEPDDVRTNADEEMLTTASDLATTHAPDGSLAFFYATYAKASTASCDPTEALSGASDSESDPILDVVDTEGRRLRRLSELESQNISHFADSMDMSAVAMEMADDAADGNSHRRRLSHRSWHQSAIQRALGSSTCGKTNTRRDGLGFLENTFGFEVPDSLSHLGDVIFDWSGYCCGDYQNRRELYFCAWYISCNRGGGRCGLELETDLADFPGFRTFSESLGIESIEAKVKVTTVPDRHGNLRLEAPTGNNRNCFTRRSRRRSRTSCYNNKCKHDVRQTLSLDFSGTETHPWGGWYFDGPGFSMHGSLTLEHDYCRTRHRGYTLSAAKTQVNTIAVEAEITAQLTWGHCSDSWPRHHFNMEMTAGISVSSLDIAASTHLWHAAVRTV